MQPRPFEEWIEKGYQRDANLCGACARPTDKRLLVRGGPGGGYIQGSKVMGVLTATHVISKGNTWHTPTFLGVMFKIKKTSLESRTIH